MLKVKEKEPKKERVAGSLRRKSIGEFLEQKQLEIHHTLQEMDTFRYDYYGFHIRFNQYTFFFSFSAGS